MATEFLLPTANQYDFNNNQHDSQDNDDHSLSASTLHTIPVEKQRNRYDWQRLLQDTWLWEFASALFSTCCFISICAVLLAYNGQVRPTWKLGLSLNALISVLATGCRASLILVLSEAISQLKWLWVKDGEPKQLLGMQVFDNASRGPLGALTMLFSHSQRSLVSLGAALTVLMLAFEPFIQQILSYPLERIEDASMPAVTYQSRAGPLYFADYPGGQSALYKALWSNNLEIQPHCPSGDCTWEPFLSLGYCSHCEDVTNWKVFDLDFGILTSEDQPWQSVGVPDVSIWEMVYQDPSHPEILNITVYDPLWSLAAAEWDFDPESIDPPGDDLGTPDVTQGMILKKASECTLEICLSEYNMSVVNHTLAVSTMSIDYGELFFIDDDAFREVNKTVCWKPTSAPGDLTLERVHMDVFDYLDYGRNVSMNTTEFAICNFFPLLLSNQYWANRGIPGPFTDSEMFTGNTRAQYYYQVQDGDFVWDGDPCRETPFATQERIMQMTLQGTFANMVAALNQYSLETNNYTINGTAYSLQVHVRVGWPWLILPALLVLLGDVFFLLTLRANRQQKGALWKSSLLANLYHGLDNVVSAGGDNDYATASEMESAAEGVRVRLEHSQSHRRVVLHQQ
ncbi:hypothetical protein BJY00DRAFT_313774 [Aspergillus carlsbadensis]|nr:hypothetical protein BJY00DRAFT_313774 [Aspergillus carlsbadensis]